ncbi:MAG: hypothetical protein WAW37_20680 [Syntrophobacteraceae bacterium]
MERNTIMDAPSTDIGLQLFWAQPSIFERHYELYAEDRLLGELCFKADGTAYGVLTIAGSATQRWTFKGTGILKPRVTIREAGANVDMAVYRHRFRGDGWLEFVNGSRFLWKSTSFWRTGRGFYNARKELLFVLKPKLFDLLKIQSVVEIEAQWHDLDELPLLLLLACYLRVRDCYAGW